jgi:indolepyruvate ferredoxin oxidoreductase alpha subunit
MSAGDPLLVDQDGHTEILLGNEAIVRGALEAGVAFACGYPGTPSSEVTDSFARVGPRRGVVFEYSVNEKIAVEMAFAASLAGARSICAMKHLGLMYAGDPISTIPYVGVVGGMVIVSAGDPSCRTSPNEQDQRHLAAMLHIPMLDPATPRQAHAMGRFAFELSERSQLPVIIRPTTRVCHSRGVVRYGPLADPVVRGFQRDPKRFVPIPINARRLRLEIPRRLEVARELIEESPFLRREGDAPVGILAAGAVAGTVADMMPELGIAPGNNTAVSLLSLGAIHPLPERWLLEQLGGLERLLVLEELSPYLEDALLALRARHGLSVEIVGKRSGHLPVPFEYEPEVIRRGIHSALGLGPTPRPAIEPPEVPPRPPILCPGCSHRSTYFAAKMAFGEQPLCFNDIGCYTLGYGPPLNSADALLCMGAGITLAAGVSRVTGQRTVGFIGDSTFFHSGLPALLNAIKEKVSMVAVILDNSVTAMTGFQESPTACVDSASQTPVRGTSIEETVRGLGARHVERIDPFDLPEAIAAFERAREAEGVSVVISERPCGVFMLRETGKRPRRAPAYVIDPARCRTCGREGAAPGGRCDVAITRGYEHHIAGARARGEGAKPRRALERSDQHDRARGEGAKPRRALERSDQHDRARAAERSAPVPDVAPCSSRCPLFLCVQGYVGHIAAGEREQALEHILSRCPLPETVCRVCHRPCEEACLRAALPGEQPVAINDLKRFAVAAGDLEFKLPREEEHGRRAAVVGAGPSGLCAAHELRLRGYAVTLLDADAEPGGLLRTGIPGFRLPREPLHRDIQRILETGIVFQGQTALGRDTSLVELLESHDVVYVAIGAHQGIRLGLPGEDDGPPVVDALAYLRQANLAGTPELRRDRAGLGGEANVDPRAAGAKKTVVVGGGNAAIDAARTARRLGAEQVTIAYRRRRSEMPALPEEVEAALAEGIELRTQLQPLSIFRGNKPGLECIQTRPGEPDASGRQRPVPVGGTETLLTADLIIAAIGQRPEPAAFALDRSLELDHEKDGSLKVDPETGRTSHPRVFAGGDLVWGERTVTWAMAQGLRAAWAIDRELRGPEAADRRPPPPRPRTLEQARETWPSEFGRSAPARVGASPPSSRGNTAQGKTRGELHTGRQRPAELPVEQRKGFDEVVAPLTEEQARAEAARCMACGLCGNCRSCIDLFGCPAFYMQDGRVQIDPAICTGCGFCADFCPNGAIHPAPEEGR